MKKVLKSRVFIFIATAVVFSSIGGVVASQILATNVSYTPSDNSWNVNNVNSAINDLYDKTKLLHKTNDTYINPIPSSINDPRIIFSSYSPNVAGEYAYSAFDKNDNTFWTSAAGDFPQYIGWDFEENVSLYKFSIKNRSDMIDTTIGSFTLQGFKNDDWEDIQSYNHTSKVRNEVSYYIVDTPRYYSKYRIKILSEGNRNANYVQVNQIDFYYIK